MPKTYYKSYFTNCLIIFISLLLDRSLSMDLEEQVEQLFIEKSIEELQSNLNVFSTQLVSQFSTCLRHLNSIHSKRQVQKDKIIEEQKAKIVQMADCISGFTKSYQQILQNANLLVNVRNS